MVTEPGPRKCADDLLELRGRCGTSAGRNHTSARKDGTEDGSMTRPMTVKKSAENIPCGVSIWNKLQSGTSQESSQFNAVIQLQPLALPPLAAAQFLSISKRSLSRLIAAGKIVARKEGSRTLVDVESEILLRRLAGEAITRQSGKRKRPRGFPQGRE